MEEEEMEEEEIRVSLPRRQLLLASGLPCRAASKAHTGMESNLELVMTPHCLRLRN